MVEKIKLKKYSMSINYDKTEHLELLKQKSGSLNSENSSKLRRYSVMTNDHLNSCIREHYLDLMENFRTGKIQTFYFCVGVENAGKLINDIVEILESNLILLSPNEKSLAFAELLEELFDTCEAYLQEDPEFRDEKDEVWVKDSVEEIYLKIQNN